ncbi:hypothetical protein VNI00_007395 [Paramarasmius palmivorus]|uniref:Uncharacterized protein n=1 Tax=Paramarasmius palmivorus TaxID=297713 RepID=A0AAW0CZY5_9AGAR
MLDRFGEDCSQRLSDLDFKQPRRSGSTVSNKSNRPVYKGAFPLKPSDISLPLKLDVDSIHSGSSCTFDEEDYLFNKEFGLRCSSPPPFLLDKNILAQFPEPPQHIPIPLPTVRPLNIQKKTLSASSDDLLPPLSSKMEQLLIQQREERLRQASRFATRRPPIIRSASDASRHHPPPQVYAQPVATRSQSSLGNPGYFIHRPVRRPSTRSLGREVQLKSGPVPRRPVVRHGQPSDVDIYCRKPLPELPKDKAPAPVSHRSPKARRKVHRLSTCPE